MKKKLYPAIILLIAIGLQINAQPHIYVSSTAQSRIFRINQDGTGEISIGSQIGARGIELDVSNNRMYFVDGGGDRIMTDDLDGTGRTVVAYASEPIDLTLDLSNQIIYFTDSGDGKIKKVNFDGTGLGEVVTSLTNPQGIDFDESTGVLFWCDSANKTINSVNADGSNQQILYTSSNTPIRLALDKTNQKIYWIERSSSLIRSSDYDGSNVAIVTAIQISTGIAIDNLCGKIYWCENTSNSLRRVNFDGTNSEFVYSKSGLSGIALTTCQDLIVQLDENGSASLSTDEMDSSISDVCGIASSAFDQTQFDCSDLGANTVTLTVTDNNGNTNSCSITVTVQDNIAPVANCQNRTIQLDENGNGAPSAEAINNGSSDVCGIASTTLDQTQFDCADVGINTVILVVSDNNGNTNSCSAIVTVQDNVAPTANCQNRIIQLDANGNGSTSAAVVANNSSDACGIASTTLDQTQFDCSDIGANTTTLIVTDNNGNTNSCSATITVQDNVVPSATCQNLVVQLDADGNGAISAEAVNNGSADACGIASTILDQTQFSCNNIGDNTVTLTVSDTNGSTNFCTATITVEDNVSPIPLCQDITIQLDADGQASITPQNVDNGSSDACSTPTLSLSRTYFDCTEVGDNSETMTVSDGSGNTSSCSTTITVADNMPPVASCLNAAVIFNGESSISLAANQLYDATGSTDNCGSVTLVSPVDGAWINCADAGSTVPVTVQVEDANGNSTSCTASVLVNGLPCGWVDNGGIGCLDNLNSSSFDQATEITTVTANNCALPGWPYNTDQMAFVFTELCDDGEIIARVTGVTGTGFCGVMMRDNESPSSPFMAMGTNSVNRVLKQVRILPAYPAFPQFVLSSDISWVRLVRNGNQFKGFASVDGATWVPYLNQSIFMANSCIQVGLYAFSEKPGNSLSASFDNVYVMGQNNALSQLSQSVALGESHLQELTVNVFPNPANGLLFIQVGGFEGQYLHYHLLNVLGQPQQQQQTDYLETNNLELDVSRLAPGLYYLVIEGGGQKVTKQIVITR